MKRESKTITVNTTGLSHDGRGIATIDGITTFISGALANETITCKIKKRHRRYNEAEIIEVITPSLDRTKPLCAHFGTCGGCSLQHMVIDSQIQLKQKTLLEQLKHFGKVVPEKIFAPITGNPWNYRRKARLGVRFDKTTQRAIVGFRSKSSNSLIDVTVCPVLQAQVGSHIGALGELITHLTQAASISQIEVTIDDKVATLMFRHLTALPDEDLTKIIEFGKNKNFHIYLQPNAPEKIHKIFPVDDNSKLTYFLPEYQLEMLFEPLDFIQVNGEINHLMLKQALLLLAPKSEDKILDLFCGLGNFTLPIARFCEQVTGVEGSQEMVLRAQNNAQLNHINHVDFHAANLASPSSSAPWLQKKYDKILLDPPRTGAKEIIQFFPKLGAKRIIYVSCNPATLARDAHELVYNQGYKLKEVGVINMFPHTSHIEAIAMFEK